MIKQINANKGTGNYENSTKDSSRSMKWELCPIVTVVFTGPGMPATSMLSMDYKYINHADHKN